MRGRLTVFAIVALCTCCAAQLPDAPQPQAKVADRAFYLAVAPMWASSASDALSTTHALATGQCYEVNPLLGRDPHAATVWAFAGGMAAGYTWLTYWLKGSMQRRRSHSRAWTIPARVLTGVHVAATVNNVAKCR